MFSLDDMPSQKGRVAIVTGANTGLGFETTKGLAKKDMHVVMACRNPDKAKKAREDILADYPKAKLELMQLDLNSLQSVRDFAEAYRKKHKKLDVLVNNAGIMIPPYELTEDGFESQLGVNFLGHFLLTSLLIELMPDVPESRVVSLASIAHKQGKIHFDDLQSEKRYVRFEAYAQSKLACLIFGNELSQRLQQAGKKIVSVSAHPGVSLTELVRHIPMPKFVFTIANATIAPAISHPPREGAKPSLLAAMGPDVKGGDYYGPTGFREMKGPVGVAKMKRVAQDRKVAEQLWEVSEELTGCTFKV